MRRHGPPRCAAVGLTGAPRLRSASATASGRNPMAVTQVSKTDKPQGAATNGKSAGKPDEAASAFAKEVVAAIRAQELGAGDGGTAAAIALGWNVAALATVDVACTAAAAGGAAAAGLLSLSEDQ